MSIRGTNKFLVVYVCLEGKGIRLRFSQLTDICVHYKFMYACMND